VRILGGQPASLRFAASWRPLLKAQACWGGLAPDLHPGHARGCRRRSSFTVRGPRVVSVMIFDNERGGEFSNTSPRLALLLQVLTLPLLWDRAHARAGTGLHAEADRDMSKLVPQQHHQELRRLRCREGSSRSSCKKGEFVSLLGPSGCGKDHDLAHDRGLHAAFVRHDRARWTDRSPPPRASCRRKKRRMSMIFQSYAIWPKHDGRRKMSASACQVAQVSPSAEIDRRVEQDPRCRPDARV